MTTVRKIWKFISSMQFAILLLVILAAACAAASFVTQGQTYAWYAQQYSERTAAFIVAAHLDDAFHSWWFIAINAFLCLNLLSCNLIRLPQNIRRTKEAANASSAVRKEGMAKAEHIADPEAFFRKMGFSALQKGSLAKTADADENAEAEPGKENAGQQGYIFSVKHRAGIWGAWVCHLGILFIILGFSLGQMTKEQYTAYGVPGQSRMIGDTGLVLTIDDFRIGLRTDDTVEQYTADITVRDLDGRSESAEISVNYPATLFGMKFYQNSTGWAANVHITENGEPLQEEVVCAGDYIRVADKKDLVIYLNAFYPDYVMEPGVGPSTASSELRNPAYLYSVYYQNQMLGMNALLETEELKIDEYTVTFSDPQSYTLIQIKKDRFTWLALLGGVVTMIGLVLAFYLQTSRVWAVEDENGTWTVHGECRKGGVIFKDQFKKTAEEMSAGKES